MRIHRRLLAVSALSALVAGVMGQSKALVWVPVQQDIPRQALTATPLGIKPSTDVLHISLAMPYGDPVGMQRFVDSVSNPASPNYRKFVTPDQVGQRFGLPTSAVKKVSDYLASQGMKVRLVGKNRLSILADATVAQAQTAFHVAINEYSTTLRGQSAPTVCFSSTGSPSVPASIAPFVQYIGGLENFVRPTPTDAVSPTQLRTLYSVAPLWTNGFQGVGRTVAISNWTTYGLYNLQQAYPHWNLPTPPNGIGTNVTVISIDGANGEVSGNAQVECDIDIQTVLEMAPLCNLLLYDNANNSDIIGVLTKEADDNLADLITESYAWDGPTPLFVAAHNLHLSMSAQGITYLCASGDWGSQGLVNLYYPDEDPEVLSVGGTQVAVDTLGNRLSEVAWGDSGGGWAPNADPFNVAPPYQQLPSFLQGLGVPANIPYRLVPDVCLNASPGSPYEPFIDGVLQPYWGGTSCASPTVAGALAVCEAMLIANGGLPPDAAGNQRLGRIQDLIYSFNGDPTVFYDVTSGGNGTLPNGAASNAGAGWDTATGWGSMIFSGFVARVLNFPQETAMALSPSTVIAGGTSTGTVAFAAPVRASTATLILSSSNLSATVPTSISIAQGANSATFSINTGGVSVPTTTTITANFAGSIQTASLTINPATPSNVSVAPGSVIGGNRSMGTVTLNGPAGPSGLAILLTASGPATVPSTILVAAGAASATFPVTTSGVSASTQATITAEFGGVSQSATLTVTPAGLSSISISPNPVIGGAPATGTVMLSGLAPTGGVTVTLSASKASVPATVTIPGGSTSATFAVTTKPVSAATAATVSANYNQITQSSSLTIDPAAFSDLTLSPTTVVGGSKTAVTGTVTFTGLAPPAGISVSLASSNTKLATTPSTVRIQSGSSSAIFTVIHKAVATPQTVTITAKVGSITKQATITLQPASLVSVSVSPSSVKGSSTTAVTGTLTLSGPAPSGGLTIAIQSSNSSVVSVPATVMIPAGSSGASFKVTHKKVASSTAVTISATLSQTTVTTTLTVTP